MNLNEKLSPSFTLGEFLVTEQDQALMRKEFLEHPKRSELLQNLRLLAQRLQVIRDIYNAPVVITSGWRSKRVNDAVGGEDNSFHMKGMAADIQVKGVPPKTVQALLKNWSGGLGEYEKFTHVDIRAKKERF